MIQMVTVIEKTAEAVKRDRHFLNITEHILQLMLEEIDANVEKVALL